MAKGIELICDLCNQCFYESSNTIYCSCGSIFCSFECSSIDYCEYDDNEESTGNDAKEPTCSICRKEEAGDLILFKALLKHFNLTREQATEIWSNQK